MERRGDEGAMKETRISSANATAVGVVWYAILMSRVLR
jgi:hypothetical protein